MAIMRFVAAVGSALALLGCSGSDQVVQVRGRVLVDGEPAPGVQVLFHPQGIEGGVTASGVTAEDGSFTLISAMQPGVKVGSYRVTAIWPDPKVQPTEVQKMMGMAEPGPDLLSGRYSLLQKSELTVEIRSDVVDLPPLELSTPGS